MTYISTLTEVRSDRYKCSLSFALDTGADSKTVVSLRISLRNAGECVCVAADEVCNYRLAMANMRPMFLFLGKVGQVY